jgi:stearoyl-CoA desaturase (delta-9 desaturase)
MYCLSGLGISVGYHRLVTHRAFTTTPWVKRLILICGSFAMQGGPGPWASLHIQHHRFADKPGDPHSPVVDGFWQSHCGWIFRDYQPDFRRYGKWLLEDKDVRHVTKYYLLYSNLGLIIPALLGGWVGFIWAGLLRLFVCCHMTWAVNSVCHQWGGRLYSKTPDTSTNNVFVALMTFGEGWHNNHHRYMQMPFFGHKWYQIDFGKWLILMLKNFGLAWDLKVPKMTDDTKVVGAEG